VLTITDWAAFGDDAAPPGSPTSQPALPAQQQYLPPVAAAQKKPDHPAQEGASSRADIDDEIPF
jgi:hypothetical protein